MDRRFLCKTAVILGCLLCGCAKEKPADLSSISSDELVSIIADKETADVREELIKISSVNESRKQETAQTKKESSEEEPASPVESTHEVSSETERESEVSSEDVTSEEASSEVDTTSSSTQTQPVVAPTTQTQPVQTRPVVQPSDYLTQLCAGSHMVPYGVATIDDSDTPIVNKLFQNTVVIGDSRVEGVAWVLDESRVFDMRGGYAGKMIDTARQAGQVYPQKALFFLGLNDMGIYEDHVDRYVQDYVSMVNALLEVAPDCKIYVHNQPAVPQKGLDNYAPAVRIGMYNEAMRQMCAEHGWTYIDGSTYLQESYFGTDGLHFSKAFYRLWIQDMAVQLDLWGDLTR